MAYLIDAIAIVIVFVFVYWKAKCGFIKTVATAAGMVLAAVVAIFLSQQLAPFIYDHVVLPRIQEQVSGFVQGSTSSQDLAQALFENRLLSAGFFTAGWTSDSLAQKLNETMISAIESPAQMVVQQIIRPIIVELLQTIIFVVLLFVLTVLVRLAARGINKLISITPVGRLNALLGGLFGVLEGVVIVIALFALLTLLINLYPGFLGLDQKILEQTFIYRTVYSVL